MEERFETFTLLIASISRSIRRLKTEETAEYNLKSPHVSILYQLYKEGSLTAAEICEACDEDKAAVSRSIVYLEQNGFLTRSARREGNARGAGKHYRAALNLTERGREVAAGLAESIDEVLDEVAEGVTEEERRILYRALGEIDRILSKLCEGRDGNGNESN